jgi:phospholipid/cholesterol/gamma-HCH transport system permease protein
MKAANPVRSTVEGLGGFYAMCLDAALALVRTPFQWKEFLEQTMFIARVSLVPTILVAVPLCTNIVFLLNNLLLEIGAGDMAGAAAFLGSIREIGPIVTVLVVAGAGATAICADLGARTIRDEIDAIRVMGIDPIARLVVPRVLASTLVAILLNPLVAAVGITGGYLFSVYLQHITPGLYVVNLSLLSKGVVEIVFSEIKAAVFGLLAGLVACHRGLTVSGGPKGVGDAVNQTVVLCFVLLFVANTIITAVFLQVTGS